MQVLSLLASKIKPNRYYGICLVQDTLKKDFGFVLPRREFLQQLYAGEII